MGRAGRVRAAGPWWLGGTRVARRRGTCLVISRAGVGFAPGAGGARTGRSSDVGRAAAGTTRGRRSDLGRSGTRGRTRAGVEPGSHAAGGRTRARLGSASHATGAHARAYAACPRSCRRPARAGGGSVVGSTRGSGAGLGSAAARRPGPAGPGARRAFLESRRGSGVGHGARRPGGAARCRSPAVRLGPPRGPSRTAAGHRRALLGRAGEPTDLAARCRMGSAGRAGLGHPQDRGAGRSGGSILGSSRAARGPSAAAGETAGRAAGGRPATTVERGRRADLDGLRAARAARATRSAGCGSRIHGRRPGGRRSGRAAAPASGGTARAPMARRHRERGGRGRHHGLPAAC